MTPTLFQSWQAVLNFIWTLGCAGAGLPVIITLGLISGRRGDGQFRLYGNGILLHLAVWLSAAGMFYIAGDYVLQISSLSGTEKKYLEPLFSLAGLPYTTAFTSWLAGFFCLLAAEKKLPRHSPEERYPASFVKGAIIFCLLATACFFASFSLINWPFAGLPENLGWDRAAMAIFRNSLRHYFMTFAAAGACGLLAAFYCLPASLPQRTYAIRWLAIWGILGYLPNVLTRWGIVLGAGLGGSHGAAGLSSVVIALVCITVAMACWLFLLLAKKPKAFVAWLAFALLAFHNVCPYLFRLWGQLD